VAPGESPVVEGGWQALLAIAIRRNAGSEPAALPCFGGLTIFHFNDLCVDFRV
jgi:hypothetical protein